MKVEHSSLQDLEQGYAFHADTGTYACGICGKTYETGEIHVIGDRLFEAARAMEMHLELEHGDYLHQLIDSDSKYNTLTENQRQLCKLFAADCPDKDIAKQLGVATSTIRHQKFIFREKAKQAKLYLAQYERVFGRKTTETHTVIPIHDHAKMVDERYVVTPQERQHILETSFLSMEPLKLKTFSPREKKKIVILARIAQEFQPETQYSEKEVNAILSPVFDDFAILRRYLIEYGFINRTKDGSRYWLT